MNLNYSTAILHHNKNFTKLLKLLYSWKKFMLKRLKKG